MDIEQIHKTAVIRHRNTNEFTRKFVKEFAEEWVKWSGRCRDSGYDLGKIEITRN